MPTVDLASKHEVGAVVLHSALMSGVRILVKTKRTWCFDAFPSIDKIPKVMMMTNIQVQGDAGGLAQTLDSGLMWFLRRP